MVEGTALWPMIDGWTKWGLAGGDHIPHLLREPSSRGKERAGLSKYSGEGLACWFAPEANTPKLGVPPDRDAPGGYVAPGLVVYGIAAFQLVSVPK